MCRRLLFLLLLLAPGIAPAVTDATDPYARFLEQNDYDESLEVPWVELEVQVGQGPDWDALVELDNGRLPPGMRLFADLEHLSVSDEDHVSRLWLVVRSRQGAENASYEGIRCATGEYKVYAYYNPRRSKPLRTVKLPRWRPIRSRDWRAELARDTLCADTTPRDPDAVRAKPYLDASDYRSPYE